MRKTNLVLMPAYRDIAPFSAGVLLIDAAAKYVKIDKNTFGDLVRQGAIKARRHPGRKHNIFLKEDLDDYLHGLPVVNENGSKIPAGEVPSKPPFPQEATNG